MISVELAGTVVSALVAAIVALTGAVVYLYRRGERRADADRREMRENARALRLARYQLERKKGVPSTPPPPDWDEEPSVVTRAHAYRDRRWIESEAKACAKVDAVLADYLQNGKKR